ncbi:GGDEF domain-containing protein [Arcobacter vandammei]|uniref:GGDEF domain-containing protein n=1 Tax=Arcobacter vandammei TaxID=2782243 RepID=UPI0018E0572F|nr:GGDEF domain-containing protein [Arcobacter vandammei]
MSYSCELIMNENDKLKLSDLDKSALNIYEYLKIHHEIDALKIEISKQEDKENIFSLFDLDKDYIEFSLEFPQNINTKVIFIFLANNEDKKEKIIEQLDKIKMSLHVFSQSLYNKYIEKTISNMSLIDPVTGTYNRAYLNNYVTNLLSLSNREQKKVAFIKIGIDQFKAVVDEFDYETGDKVLKALANTLKNSVRESDIVIKISNDEFLVILLNILSDTNAVMIAEKLINNFSKEAVVVDENTKQILMKTICGGISIFPDNATTIDEIIKKSDIALYEARNRGRGKVFLFNDEETNKIDLF